MLEDVSLIRNFNDARLFYFKYKDSPQFVLVLVVVIALISFIVVGRFVIPQLENWVTLQSQVKQKQAEIKVLEQNQALVSDVDQVGLNSKFDVVTKALPYLKDYSGIISAIDLATVDSGVIRDDYTFSVGNLSTQSAKLADNQSLSFRMSVKGNIEQVKSFLTSLSQKLPLSEIVSLNVTTAGGDIEILFFYRTLPDDLKIKYTTPIPSLSADKEALMRTLTEWKEKSPEAQPSLGNEGQEGSDSGSTTTEGL